MQEYEDYLMHHGILGRKWGIRRYQNEDGTLTETGKARQAKLSNKFEKKLARYNKVQAKAFKKRVKADTTRNSKKRETKNAKALKSQAKANKKAYKALKAYQVMEKYANKTTSSLDQETINKGRNLSNTLANRSIGAMNNAY